MRQMFTRAAAGVSAAVVLLFSLLIAAPAHAADGQLAVTGQDGGAALTIGIIALVVIAAGVLFLFLRRRTPKE